MLICYCCRLTSVPPEIFSDCTSLFTLSLHDNPITAAALRDLKGFTEFDIRRKGKYSKQVFSGVPMLCTSAALPLSRQQALSRAVLVTAATLCLLEMPSLITFNRNCELELWYLESFIL